MDSSWTPVLQPVLSIVLMAAATAIASAVTAVGVKLARKFGVEATATDQQNFEHELHTCLDVGIVKFLPLIEAQGWNSRAVHDAILNVASDFLRQRFPDRAKAIAAAAQVDNVPTTTALVESLSARLPQAMISASRSPATPAVPPPVA